MRLLNVGGCNKQIPIPPHFAEYEHVLLDIEPNPEVDVVCDARDMFDLPESGYDAIYCSHNLEHYHRHELPRVLKGFHHVLSDEGFVHIRVPNMKALFDVLVKSGADIEDVMYSSEAGDIKAIDMIYGLGSFIESSGKDFMCHKNGFTPKSLGQLLFDYGFEHVFIGTKSFDLTAFAFKKEPTAEQIKLLNLKQSENQHEQAVGSI